MRLFILLLVLFMGCDDSTLPENDTSELIQGTWVYDHDDYGINVYYKSENFSFDKPGFHFSETGDAIVRMISGPCGTPPVSYENNEGTWELTDDIVDIHIYNDWIGDLEIRYQIISVDTDSLRFEHVGSLDN